MAFSNFLRLTWSTDLSMQFGNPGVVPSSFGPDGPWQAVVVQVGNSSGSAGNSDGSLGIYVPLYPSGGDPTQLITVQAGGNYDPSNSSTAVQTDTTVGESDSWFSSAFTNETSTGQTVYDLIGVASDTNGVLVTANATIAANSNWSIPLPNGSMYSQQVGILGLGNPDFTGSGSESQPWMLDEMKNSGSIPSKSFAMHIGSVSKNISGSMLIGGYDKARFIGPVGKFWYLNGTPFAILRDINAGVAAGGSPFPADNSSNLYVGNGGGPSTESVLQTFGAPAGSTIAIPNPAYPYIALPPGNCEAIVSKLQLPVTYDKATGFYMWNRDDPKFATIVGSPAHLEFVLADTSATNISIKVPFALLNLTLEAPIINKPASYFPCKSMTSEYGFWTLGRAFLQAATMGLNFEQNVTWLAQAPGPSLQQSVFQEIAPSDTALVSSSMDTYEQTWSGDWQELTSNGTAFGADNSATSDQSSASGLTGGEIAGVVIGVLVACALLAGAGFWYWRRKRQPQEEASEPMASAIYDGNSENRSGPVNELGNSARRRPELDGQNTVGPEMEGYQAQELGGGRPYEVVPPMTRYELDGSNR